MKTSHFFAAAFMAILLVWFSCGSAPASERPDAGTSRDDLYYIEGMYYGKQTITFTLRIAKDQFIKTYGNGIQIIGERKGGGVTYYFIDQNKRLLTKVSQAGLYRIGEFTNWNAMTGLIKLKQGAKLVREKRSDPDSSCEWYRVENEQTRICMNEIYNLPIVIVENGKIVERTSLLKRSTSAIRPEEIVGNYLRKNYRFVDADDDILPNMD